MSGNVVSEKLQGIEPTRELKILGRGGDDAWLEVSTLVKGQRVTSGDARYATLNRDGMVRLRDMLNVLLGDGEGGEGES